MIVRRIHRGFRLGPLAVTVGKHNWTRWTAGVSICRGKNFTQHTEWLRATGMGYRFWLLGIYVPVVCLYLQINGPERDLRKVPR